MHENLCGHSSPLDVHGVRPCASIPTAVPVRRLLLRSRIVRRYIAEDVLRPRGAELQHDFGLRQQGAAEAIGEPVSQAH